MRLQDFLIFFTLSLNGEAFIHMCTVLLLALISPPLIDPLLWNNMFIKKKKKLLIALLTITDKIRLSTSSVQTEYIYGVYLLQ